MDEIDRQLLNIIQTDFPIDKRPYAVLGYRLGISEAEALRRVQALADSGIIRRIAPSFDARSLGHVTVLAAAKVPADRLEEVAAVVSSYPEVTHNYARDFEYNLWFTLVCASEEDVDDIVKQISSKTGIADIRVLPAERTFKIRVHFEF